MPFNIVRNDLTKMKTDAIVSANGHNLAYHGAVGSAIAEAAGDEYQKACIEMGYCDTGDAKIMGGYNLPAKYIIQTVGPRYQGGHNGEGLLLRSCYEKSLALAREHGCKSISFPLIATGGYGYPKEEGLKIAADTIKDFLQKDDNGDMEIYLVVYDMETTLLGRELDANIEEYIDDNYVSLSPKHRNNTYRGRGPALRNNQMELSNLRIAQGESPVEIEPICKKAIKPEHQPEPQPTLVITSSPKPSVSKATSLESALKMRDESFHQMLFRLIEEKGLKNAEVYTGANLSKQHFSKIKNNEDYKPKKETVFALAIALKLDIDQTRELLHKAGFSLSNSFLQDIIVQYFITHKNYNIMDINFALFDHDLTLLGEKPL